MINRTQEDIMKNWNMSEIDTPLVSVKCMTYNQEKYIGQCIDGFLMQKTSFPFEILIHDDCSTDNTTDIVLAYVKKFPKIIKPILEDENQYSKHDGSHHKKIDAAIKGKYIALCEGDDYWIDENKLQMQVDFLEGNPDYGMCYSKAKKYLQSTNQYLNKAFGNSLCEFEQLLYRGNCIPTLTTCYKKDLYFKYRREIVPENKHWSMGDYSLWLFISMNSKIKFFDTEMSVYRVLQESASHFKNAQDQLKFNKSYYEIKKFFADLNNLNMPNWNEQQELFNIYYYRLIDNFNKNDRNGLAEIYKRMERKTFREVIIYILSRTKLTFKLLGLRK